MLRFMVVAGVIAYVAIKAQLMPDIMGIGSLPTILVVGGLFTLGVMSLLLK